MWCMIGMFCLSSDWISIDDSCTLQLESDEKNVWLDVFRFGSALEDEGFLLTEDVDPLDC
jgi:hypothetical protein